MGKNRVAKYKQYEAQGKNLCPKCRAYLKKGFCVGCYLREKKGINES